MSESRTKDEPESDKMNQDQVEVLKEFVRPQYAGKDSAHDFRHIERILDRLAILSDGVEPAPNMDKLCFLACFHGLSKQIKSDPAFAEEVRAFLDSIGWSEGKVEESLTSLARHLKNPVTSEEKIIHDANYLELLGAFGIAKAFTTGGAQGQLIEESADIFEHQYLDKVEFETPVGKRIAQEGRRYAKEFLKRLRMEW
jgi:HD superfamily phosphodiesterase